MVKRFRRTMGDKWEIVQAEQDPDARVNLEVGVTMLPLDLVAYEDTVTASRCGASRGRYLVLEFRARIHPVGMIGMMSLN